MEKIDLKLAFLSTYPPSRCGIATFASSLIENLEHYLNSQIKIIAVSDLKQAYPPQVIFEINQNQKQSYFEAAKMINTSSIEVVILQHEYGIFGGEDGEYILNFLENINKPIVTSLHSVLHVHSTHRKLLTQKILNLSNSVVVMTKAAKKILLETMDIQAEKIFVVPHGVPNVRFDEKDKIKDFLGLDNKKVVSTFGLLNRGKGIELAISSVSELVSTYPDILYLIIGVTHPKILEKEGEQYRRSLMRQVKEMKLTNNVRFIDSYLDYYDLVCYLKATDVYLAPQLDLNQAFSGTISYALGCGCVVVSSPTSYAKEVLSDGRGVIVEPKSEKISNELKKIFTSEDSIKKTALKSYRYARSMTWHQVGLKYLDVIEKNLFINNDGWAQRLPNFKSPPPLNHLLNNTTDFGLYQHMIGSTPNIEFGYSLDDQARALIACHELSYNFTDLKVEKYKKVYLSFLDNAIDNKGRIHNFFSDAQKYIDKNASADSIARSFWALSCCKEDSRYKIKTNKILSIYQNKLNFDHVKPISYSLLGYTNLKNKEMTILLADKLIERFSQTSNKSWQWFEDELTWANAIVILSLCKAYKLTKNSIYLSTALKSLKFLEKHSIVSGYPAPIGQKKWYKRNKCRSLFDQQPIEVADMVMLYNELFYITGEKKYKDKAFFWFGWYFGNNMNNVLIFDPITKGVCDGLSKNGVNKNQGAESIVTYLMAYSSFNKPI
ncbi:TPA: hypothetical protein DD449_04800 [Candidatus Berkelbacteria bacterium]|uniref:Group 1 glycosyl transferase n=1 Tax=Berkelbacteria bacterium GW2011_GWE1_39_12 TaxID=1618337 RepID=A0A0G4B4Q1_9BACT|nr:MAG: group 1 glycosyl transferase [Berkelbacteria bacterium GW2011_GWE1_39_12]HBO60974.1 hypothetical protein [Candidatus Berkelbacteria bacterium]